jgi:hypothetical protein
MKIDNPPIRSLGTGIFTWLLQITIAAIIYPHKPLVAIVITLIATVFHLIGTYLPKINTKVVFFLKTLGRIVGLIISRILLFLIYAFVFCPIGVLNRIAGVPRKILKPTESTWESVAPQAPNNIWRTYLIEDHRFRNNTTFSKIRRISNSLIGLVLFTVMLDVTMGYFGRKVYREINTFVDSFQPQSRSRTKKKDDWQQQYEKEFIESGKVRFEPYIGWRREDYSGQFINVRNGIRRTVHPSTFSNSTAKKYRIWFFGGSAVWGTGARDQCTLPSELARIASENGLNWEVVNYGESGYVMWQEITLLSRLCAEDTPPDVVLFYDGPNDLFAKLQSPHEKRPTQNLTKWREWHGNMIACNVNLLEAAIERYTDYSILSAIIRSMRNTTTVPSFRDAESIPVDSLKSEVLHEYQENREFAMKLAKCFKFQCLFFYQPTVYTKRFITETEQLAADNPGFSPTLYRDLARQLSASVNNQNVVNLTNIFNDETTYFLDFVHTNELGNKVIASRIFEAIPQKR